MRDKTQPYDCNDYRTLDSQINHYEFSRTSRIAKRVNDLERSKNPYYCNGYRITKLKKI